MIRLGFGMSDPKVISFPEFITWIRGLYKTVKDSTYMLDINVYISVDDDTKDILVHEEQFHV